MSGYAPPPPQKRPLNERLDALEKYVEMTQKSVREGQMPDMSGLEDTVGTLCQAIESSPRETARPLAIKMKEVIGKLDELEISIKKAQD